MFISEEIKVDRRPALTVFAPERDFLYKYFDREFDRRPVQAFEPSASDMPAFLIQGVDGRETPEAAAFRKMCAENNLKLFTLRCPDIIGTGMEGLMMRMARGVARGTLMRIKDNKAVRSVIHATDVAKAARAIAAKMPDADSFTVAAEPVAVNDLVDALSFRIKNKRPGNISQKWARLLYGSQYFATLTSDSIVDVSSFTDVFPDFRFANPAEYLKTHTYDDESL